MVLNVAALFCKKKFVFENKYAFPNCRFLSALRGETQPISRQSFGQEKVKVTGFECFGHFRKPKPGFLQLISIRPARRSRGRLFSHSLPEEVSLLF